MKSPSLHRQLLIWLLIPILLLWILGGLMTYSIAVRFSDLANDRSLFDSTLTLAGQVKMSGNEVVVDLPHVALKMLEMDPYDKVYFKVSDRTHGRIAGAKEISPPPENEIVAEKPYYHDGKIDGNDVRIASFYLPGSNRSDWVLVQVGETLKKRRMLADEILAGVVLPQLLLIALGALLLWYGVRQGLSSLDELRLEVSNRTHLDLSPFREKNVPWEIGSLIQALNGLLKRLDSSISAQNRFIADAAHQLRTPLAGLKTQTDFALRQSDPEQIQHSLRLLQKSSERTIHLVNQLLSLARAEPGYEIAKTRVDVASLAGKTTAEWVREALKKEIDLGFDALSGDVFISGSEVLLREMLNNLIDNAIRYTQAHGKVTVKVEEKGDNVVLAVEDNGPGIPQSEREHIFDRFHRVLGSGEDGCGLGLAIAKEIAHAHNAEINLLNETVGSVFQVIFPKG